MSMWATVNTQLHIKQLLSKTVPVNDRITIENSDSLLD